MQDKLQTSLSKTKKAQSVLATLPHATRKSVLKTLAEEIKKNKKAILRANAKDIAVAKEEGKNSAYIDRLSFSESSFNSMLEQVLDIAKSKDVLGKVIEKKIIADGLILNKISVPLGVLAVIYESRPNVTIDVAALSIMSGNACVLKGGSDVLNTNSALIKCIHKALKIHKVPLDSVLFLNTKDRKIVDQLVKQDQYIDVLIPRGGYGLVKKIVNQSRIPILYHAAGGARIYVDEFADFKKAIPVCINAKTNRPATCNSLDCVLVHKKIAKAFIPQLVQAFQNANVEIRGDSEVIKIAPVKKAKEADYSTEFLDYIVVIKVVGDTSEAIEFIHKYTKKHSEGIISENKKAVTSFVNAIDAAGVFVNCSTRLNDGGTFGLGAEIGIATGKLHARGPVGLTELTTYKWVAYGNGNIRK